MTKTQHVLTRIAARAILARAKNIENADPVDVGNLERDLRSDCEMNLVLLRFSSGPSKAELRVSSDIFADEGSLPKVEVSWPSIGSVSVAEATGFARLMTDVVRVADVAKMTMEKAAGGAR